MKSERLPQYCARCGFIIRAVTDAGRIEAQLEHVRACHPRSMRTGFFSFETAAELPRRLQRRKPL
jgi:hypothetical protein